MHSPISVITWTLLILLFKNTSARQQTFNSQPGKSTWLKGASDIGRNLHIQDLNLAAGEAKGLASLLPPASAPCRAGWIEINPVQLSGWAENRQEYLQCKGMTTGM